MAKRKPTVGEKVVCGHNTQSLERLRESPMYIMDRKLARRIDRAVRQAFNDGCVAGRFVLSDCASDKQVYAKYAAKYGVKP